jgi:hypothetical protein
MTGHIANYLQKINLGYSVQGAGLLSLSASGQQSRQREKGGEPGATQRLSSC